MSNAGNFGSIGIGTGNITFTGLNDPNSPFDGMLFYQRRANRTEIQIGANGANMSGTLYAKWARLNLTHPGASNCQCVTNTLTAGARP